MSDGKIFVGLDIGTTKVAVVVGRFAHGNLDVLGYNKVPSRGVSKGVVQNIGKTTEDIKGVVEGVLENIGEQIDIEDVVVNIAGRQVTNYRSTEILAFEKETIITDLHIRNLHEKASDLVLRSGEESIMTIVQSYYVDGQVTSTEPVGRKARRIEVRFLSVIFEKSSISNIKKCVSDAGLKVKDVFLSSWASALATLNEEELEKGVALVDIGGGTTDLAIVQDKKIRHSTVILLGVGDIIKKIQDEFDLSKCQVERLKNGGYMCAWSKSIEEELIIEIPRQQKKEVSLTELVVAIQSEMTVIVEKIKREINDYLNSQNNHFGNDLYLVLTGEGSKIIGLKELVRHVTKAEAKKRLVKDVRIRKPRKEIFGESEALNYPFFATAIGLLRHASFLGSDDTQEEVTMGGQDKDFPKVKESAKNDSKKKNFFNRINLFEFEKVKEKVETGIGILKKTD